jgi:hypothetical protein
MAHGAWRRGRESMARWVEGTLKRGMRRAHGRARAARVRTGGAGGAGGAGPRGCGAVRARGVARARKPGRRAR